MKSFASAVIVSAALVAATIGVPTSASAAAARPAPSRTESVGAASLPSRDRGGIVTTAPLAPRVVGIAATPTISPSVKVISVAPGGSYTCSYGNFCAEVWNGSVWRVFFLYNCHIYDIYNWTGTGYWRNNQSAGAPSPYLLDASGFPQVVLNRSPSSGSVNWDPIYSISNCY